MVAMNFIFFSEVLHTMISLEIFYYKW